jgi:hypothetical protein
MRLSPASMHPRERWRTTCFRKDRADSTHRLALSPGWPVLYVSPKSLYGPFDACTEFTSTPHATQKGSVKTDQRMLASKCDLGGHPWTESDGLENRGRLSGTFCWCRPISFGSGNSRRQTWLSLAVSPPTQWTVTDAREPEWTPVDTPPTVLKTAGLTSADVHDGPPRFDLCRRYSAVVRHHPQSSVGLAVVLAVSHLPQTDTFPKVVHDASATMANCKRQQRTKGTRHGN